ncbi:hypothetical protein SUGI_0470500 [Cryptomeria japonica]|nr:hypothetical protein SUGI_0470500 [Cryptomeria japonica]
MEQHFKTKSAGHDEDSSHNTTHFVSTQYSDGQDLWSSPFYSNSLSHNSCVKLDTFDNNLISLSPEFHSQSFQNPICSNNQLQHDDFTMSSYSEPQTPFTDFLVKSKHFMDTTIPWLNSGNAFVEWRNYSPPFTSLQPTKSQFLHKRCISFLSCIQTHKISSFNANNGGKSGLNNNCKIYDKLAIHHAVAERKRREEMRKIVFVLRSLLPAHCKRSKAKVLLKTIDYVNYLKRRVEVLEKRNSELEAYLQQSSLHSHDTH